ncbi:hypothetical protein ACFL35_04985 [Candidatus Riflebacteria bacterium]
MQKLIFISLISIILFSGSTLKGENPARKNKPAEIHFFENPNFTGRKVVFRPGDKRKNLDKAINGFVWDNKISSIKITGSDFGVAFYEHPNYLGYVGESFTNIRNLKDVKLSAENWNNRISSFKVIRKKVIASKRWGLSRRRRSFIEVYTEPDFQGDSARIYTGDKRSNLITERLWSMKLKKRISFDNKISSLKIFGSNISLMLYEFPLFSGEEGKISRDIADLSSLKCGSSNWNNKISSLEAIKSSGQKIKQSMRGKVPLIGHGERIEFYENNNFRGGSFVLEAGESLADLSKKIYQIKLGKKTVERNMNNKISSIRVLGNLIGVNFFEKSGYKGKSSITFQSIPDMSKLVNNWDNQVSSLKVLVYDRKKHGVLSRTR